MAKVEQDVALSLDKVRQHHRAGDCWVVVDGGVYDLSTWLQFHPGGDAPLAYAGQDASAVFHSIHDDKILERFKVSLWIGSVEKKVTDAKDTGDSDAAGQQAQATPRHREFTDHMAAEGETSHIPSVVLVMYICIAAWSLLAQRFTGCSAYTMFGYYIAGMLAFYGWHRLAHSPWTGPMYRIHMNHHLEKYPPSAFYGIKEDTIRKDLGCDRPTFWQLCSPFRTVTMEPIHEGPLYLMMAAILVSARLLIAHKLSTIFMALVMYVVMGIIGNALHMSFHVRDFELERCTWYMELRTLHYIHHLGKMTSNFAMLNLGIEGLFSSLACQDPLQKRRVLQHLKKDGVLMSNRQVRLARQHSGVAAFCMGLDVPIELGAHRTSAVSRGYPTVLLRLFLIWGALQLWWLTEAPARPGGRHPPTASWKDLGHTLAAPLQSFLQSTGVVGAACATSLLASEILVLALLGLSLLGETFRPFLALTFGFLGRLAVGAVTDVPVPGADAWQRPSWLSLGLVTNTFVKPNELICARVLLADIALLEACQRASKIKSKRVATLLLVSAAAVLLYQVLISVALRTNFTFDVLVTLALGRYASLVAKHYSHFVDSVSP